MTVDEIRGNDHSLRMGFYVPLKTGSAENDPNCDGLTAQITNWVESQVSVRGALKTITGSDAQTTPQSFEVHPCAAKVLMENFDRSKWKRVRFGDVVNKISDRIEADECGLVHYIGGEHFDNGTIRFARKGVIEGSTIGPAFHMRFKPGHVLYMSRNPHLRKASVVDFEGICANTSYVCEAVSDKLRQELLPFVMQSDAFWNWGSENKRGSTNPYLNWKDIASFEFDLPPLDQQRRIAEILWAVDVSLGANDGLESSLLEYRQSLLDSIAHEYSESHALAPLDSAIEQGRPICYGILMPGLGIENGIPVVKVRDFPDGYIREDDLLQTTPEIEAPYRRSRLKSGDLIISIRGTIGRMAEVPPSLDGANITQDTARLSIAPKHNRGYLRAVLESRFVERQIQSRITGLAVKGINIGELRQIQIPLPSRSKQDEIAEKLSAISAAQNAAAANSKQVRSVLSASIENLLGGSSR